MNIKHLLLAVLLTVAVLPAAAQFDLGRLIQGGVKVIQAVTLSDDDINAYVHEYVQKSDSANKVLPASNPYSQRLARLTSGITDVDGTPLNFKVYQTEELNAFACADGSVRVYTGLMDAMTDDEVLGVIGHEIGHVAHHDSRNAFKQALINSAILDGLASTSAKIATLTDSQFGAIGNALATSKFSKKQENNADEYGYEFLKKHGKNPGAMALAFKRLQEVEQSEGIQSNAVNQLFSSHPQLEDRIKKMEKKAIKDGYMDANGNLIGATTQSANNVTSTQTSTTKKVTTSSAKKITKTHR